MPLRHGDRVGAYMVRSAIEDDTYLADAYLAERVGLAGFQKVVDLYVLESDEPDAIENFLREARLAARLTHANIAQIFDVGEDGGRHFIAVERVDGMSLKDAARRLWASKQGIPLEVITRIGTQIATALAAAHAMRSDDGAQLVHGALSTDRVMLLREGSVKLVGLGVPMRVRVLDARDDLRALGALLSFCLADSPLTPKALDDIVRELSDTNVVAEPKKIAHRISQAVRATPGNVLARFFDRALMFSDVTLNRAIPPVPATMSFDEAPAPLPDLDARTVELKRHAPQTKLFAIAGAAGAGLIALAALVIALLPDPEPPPPPPPPVAAIIDAGVADEPVVDDPPIAPIEPPASSLKESKPRIVDTLAPPYVAWETVSGRRLGMGNGKITLPSGERVMYAVDTKTGGKSEVTVSTKLDYNTVGKGTLQLSAEPPADIVMGSVKLGKTPQTMIVPAGTYKLKFVRDGKSTEKRVVVRKDRTTKVSP